MGSGRDVDDGMGDSAPRLTPSLPTEFDVRPDPAPTGLVAGVGCHQGFSRTIQEEGDAFPITFVGVDEIVVQVEKPVLDSDVTLVDLQPRPEPDLSRPPQP